jgi:L-2-hydroxyglutarate oxidase LhgO
VDFTAVCHVLARLVGDVRLSTRVTGVHEQRGARVVLETTSGDVEARRVVNCAGLWSDRVAARLGPAGLRDVEPHATGIAALHVPSAAIVEVEAADLRPSPPGVRAQAVARDGTLVDDFVIRHSGRVVDVLNAPSPGATASLEIGRAISEEVIRRAAG